MGKGEKDAVRNTRSRISQTQPVNFEHERLIAWFKNVKFRKSAFGGIDEISLWRKLEELNGLYEDALVAERARYNALIRKERNGDD